ncbi:MAG: rhomboid family intramembrane serine protease [Treponema sp.]|jgi:membrane associated rhomboid family serine protease|nr:rhomboid family intramembrane serine protease [Treponema sp.]
MYSLQRTFRYSYHNAVLYLVGINVLVFALQNVSPMLTYYLALIPGAILSGWMWQFVTYMFTHGGVTHILFNMLALFIFGTQVERQIGTKEFLAYYFATGILAGVFSFAVYFFTGTNVILLGASGAVFAVQLAYAALFPRSIMYVWGILPLRAPVMVLGFTALEVVLSITGSQGDVAHLTHLAGFGFGWLYFLIRFGRNPWTMFKNDAYR